MEWLPDFEGSLVFIFFIVFSSLAGLHLLYVVYFYSRLAFYKEKAADVSTNLPPISIIIAARNESDNLYKFLPYILKQDYPQFEVVVVNHQSMDESYHVLNAYKMEFPHLKIVEVERSRHLGVGKKLPLTLGVKAAQFEHLVFTDADCKPESEKWLQAMASKFSDKKQIVLGYGPYVQHKGLLNKIIRFDTAMIGMSYFSLAMARVPYMGVGRNFAYTKTVFNSVNGFKSHYSISSGDDDLFVQEAARKRNYTVQLKEESFCYSEPKKTWNDWITQKSRHYSTSSRYQFIKKALLGIYPLTLLLTWISFVILLFDSEYRWLTLAIFGFLLILKWWIQGMCFSKLKASRFIALFPLLDLMYAVAMPILYYTSEKSKQPKWK
jgi:cellulose synthase/poly-beta-1,6-N-acetylglucosamine synthase-like glycosyltransferase